MLQEQFGSIGRFAQAGSEEIKSTAPRTIEKWGDVDPNTMVEENDDDADANYSRVFLLPQTHQSRKHFELNNRLIA